MAKPTFSPLQLCRADHSGQVGNCSERQLHVTYHGSIRDKNKKKKMAHSHYLDGAQGVVITTYFLAK